MKTRINVEYESTFEHLAQNREVLAERIALLEVGKAKRAVRKLRCQMRSFHLIFNEKQLALIDALFEMADLELEQAIGREAEYVLSIFSEPWED